MEYFVYILKSLKNGYFYKGMTSNLNVRLVQHDKGLTVGNKNLRPFELAFVQVCKSTVEARTLEKYLKSGSGREIIQEII